MNTERFRQRSAFSIWLAIFAASGACTGGAAAGGDPDPDDPSQTAEPIPPQTTEALVGTWLGGIRTSDGITDIQFEFRADGTFSLSVDAPGGLELVETMRGQYAAADGVLTLDGMVGDEFEIPRIETNTFYVSDDQFVFQTMFAAPDVEGVVGTWSGEFTVQQLASNGELETDKRVELAVSFADDGTYEAMIFNSDDVPLDSVEFGTYEIISREQLVVTSTSSSEPWFVGSYVITDGVALDGIVLDRQ